MKFGSITTGIITDGLVFNMDAANRASTIPVSTVETSLNTVDTSIVGTFSDNGIFDSSTITPSSAFGGTDDYINCGNQSSLSFTSNFSVCAWMKSSNQNSYAVAVAKSDSNGYSMQMRAAGDQFNFNINDGSWKNANYSLSPIDNGNWYYVVGTHNGSTIKIYVNAIKGTDGSAGSATTNSRPFFIGAEHTGQHFRGNIGPVHVYNRVLSASEVLHNYNALRGRFGL